MLKIRNIQLADGNRVDITIEGSKISRVKKATGLKKGVDGTGLIAIPGVIDPHVHFRIPGASHKEDWESGSAAALKGGVTTVFDMPNTSPPLTTIKRLRGKRRLVGISHQINPRFWFAGTISNLNEIAVLKREPDVIGVKVYMSSPVRDLLITENNDLRKIFAICAANNLMVGVHAEDEILIRAKRSALGRDPQLTDHPLIHDTEVEVSAVQRALPLAEETGCQLYFCHISTPESVEIILEAKKKGLPVFIEITPHHITLSQENLQGAEGSYFKMNPSLRRVEQVSRLREYVCDGSVDTVGSDHAPHTHQEKKRPTYDDIPSGVPGVETLLPILFNLVSRGEMTIERLIDLTSRKAAEIFKLEGRGKIEEGCFADLVLIDPNQEMIFTNSTIKTKCGWTPYQGITVKGVPKMTIVSGKIIK